jgi:hypothetical protein
MVQVLIGILIYIQVAQQDLQLQLLGMLQSEVVVVKNFGYRILQQQHIVLL